MAASPPGPEAEAAAADAEDVAPLASISYQDSDLLQSQLRWALDSLHSRDLLPPLVLAVMPSPGTHKLHQLLDDTAATGQLLVAVTDHARDHETLARLLLAERSVEVCCLRSTDEEGTLVLALRRDRLRGGGPIAGSVCHIVADHLRGAKQIATAFECVLGLAAASDGAGAVTRGICGSAAASEDPHPPWAVADATGRTLLGVSVRCADGTAHVLIPRGSCLPSGGASVGAYGEALLTSSAHDMSKMTLEVLVGARPSAAACRQLARPLVVPIEPRARGLAQVHVQLCLSATRLLLSARDVQVWCSLNSSLWCSLNSTELNASGVS